MLERLEFQQLQAMSLDAVKNYKASVVSRKAELEELKAKAKGGKTWTQALQDDLDEVALFLVDIDEIIEAKQKADAEKQGSEEYAVEKGTEKMVHLRIVRGRRFNPNTGKEESKAFTQLFTHAEWQLFKTNYKNTGCTILKVLHNPYNDTPEGL